MHEKRPYAKGKQVRQGMYRLRSKRFKMLQRCPYAKGKQVRQGMYRLRSKRAK